MSKPDFGKMARDIRRKDLDAPAKPILEGLIADALQSAFDAGLERAAEISDKEAARLACLPVHAAHAGGRKAALGIATAIRAEKTQ